MATGQNNYIGNGLLQFVRTFSVAREMDGAHVQYFPVVCPCLQSGTTWQLVIVAVDGCPLLICLPAALAYIIDEQELRAESN